MLFVGVILLVLTFRSSSALASAYGIAVNTAMIIDTLLAFMFFRRRCAGRCRSSVAVIGFILVIESAFLIANGYKIVSGGYVPMLIGIAIIIIMLTWMRGREALARNCAGTASSSRGCSKASSASRRCACRAQAFFSSPIPTSRRARCCTISNTTASCTTPWYSST